MISLKPSKTRVELEPLEKLAALKIGAHMRAAQVGMSVNDLAELLGYDKSAQAANLAKNPKAVAAAAAAAAGLGATALKGRDAIKGGFSDTMGLLKTYTGGVVLTSLLTGIPIGILGHTLGRSANKRRLKEQKLISEIDTYDDATRNLASNLAMRNT